MGPKAPPEAEEPALYPQPGPGAPLPRPLQEDLERAHTPSLHRDEGEFRLEAHKDRAAQLRKAPV